MVVRASDRRKNECGGVTKRLAVEDGRQTWIIKKSQRHELEYEEDSQPREPGSRMRLHRSSREENPDDDSTVVCCPSQPSPDIDPSRWTANSVSGDAAGCECRDTRSLNHPAVPNASHATVPTTGPRPQQFAKSDLAWRDRPLSQASRAISADRGGMLVFSLLRAFSVLLLILPISKGSYLVWTLSSFNHPSLQF